MIFIQKHSFINELLILWSMSLLPSQVPSTESKAMKRAAILQLQLSCWQFYTGLDLGLPCKSFWRWTWKGRRYRFSNTTCVKNFLFVAQHGPLAGTWILQSPALVGWTKSGKMRIKLVGWSGVSQKPLFSSSRASKDL